MKRAKLLPLFTLAVVACAGDPAVEDVEETAAQCSDGIDNDLDGFTDCADYYCWNHDFCNEVDTDTDTGFDTDTTPGEQARGVHIDSVEIYQSVRMLLMDDFEGHPPTVSLIPGKGAFLRVLLSRDVGWYPRKVWVQLSLYSPSRGEEILSVMRGLYENSEQDDLDTSVNFELEPDQVADGLEYSVTVLETGSYSADEGDTDESRWPEEGRQAVAVDAPAPPLKLVIIPIRYNADGSGRLPDTSAAQLNTIAEHFYKTYPIAETEISVAEPYDWNITTQATPPYAGWDSLLNAITAQRGFDDAEDDVYYYGLFNPASSFSQYCGAGCVAGLSHLCLAPDDAWARASIGLGFTGAMSAETMIHEVGHAHGRYHAPCGDVEGIDLGYPYDNGYIGGYGYDLVTGDLLSPHGAYDFMSYCDPDWVSDYTYNALNERIRAVDGLSGAKAQRRPWRSIILDSGGTATLGATISMATPPSGDQVEIELIGPGGGVSRTVTGRRTPTSDLLGATVLFEGDLSGIAALRVSGYPTIDLP